MHRYLAAVGFSNINRRELNTLFEEAAKWPDGYSTGQDAQSNPMTEIRMVTGEDMGIRIVGDYDDQDHFHMHYYEPYCHGAVNQVKSPIKMFHDSEKESYHGVWDYPLIGQAIVFSVDNMMDLLDKSGNEEHLYPVEKLNLSGLSVEGKVIMPIYQTTKQKEYARQAQTKREDLLMGAIGGDEKSMAELATTEMQQFTGIMRRLEKEDIMSVIQTYIIPSGIESNKYDILGKIREVRKVVNDISMEEIYVMKVEANGLKLNVCINEKDLLGVPEVGRRFKGNVWIQGNCKFS